MSNLAGAELQHEFIMAVEFFIRTGAAGRIFALGTFALKIANANDDEKRNLINIANLPRYAPFFNQFKSIQ